MSHPDEPAAEDGHTTQAARSLMEKAKLGDAASADAMAKAEQADPANTEAAEQEAADGPQGRGLSR